MAPPRLLLTRPPDEVDRSTAAAAAAGFAVCAAPLLHICPLDFRLPEATPDALLFTSPRAPARAAAHPQLRPIPAYCVGPRTAAAARELGFAVCWQGVSDGNAALREMAARGIREVLQLCGRNRIELQVPAGLNLVHRAVYEAVTIDRLPQPAQAALAAGRIFAVTLFSPRTAAHFARLLAAAGMARAPLRLVVLSGNVQVAAGRGWRAVAVAAQPTAASLFAAARGLLEAGDA